MKEAFKLILRDENVKAILVNIFGGIVKLRPDRRGRRRGGRASSASSVPLVVRLQGTNAPRRAAKILAESGLDITPAETLTKRPVPEGRRRGEGSSLTATGARTNVDSLRQGTRSWSCRAWGAWGSSTRSCPSSTAPQMVGGVVPGKGGSRPSRASPSSTPCEEAVKETGANASVVFVPPPGAADAILEAADAGIDLVVCITEGIPALDMVRAKRALERLAHAARGPELPGRRDARAVPHRHHAGLHPRSRARVGVVSRSRHADVRGRVASSRERGIGQSQRASASAATRSSARRSWTRSSCSIADDGHRRDPWS